MSKKDLRTKLTEARIEAERLARIEAERLADLQNLVDVMNANGVSLSMPTIRHIEALSQSPAVIMTASHVKEVTGLTSMPGVYTLCRKLVLNGLMGETKIGSGKDIVIGFYMLHKMR
jgi:hypothetical protein